MISLKINDINNFMQKLLIGNAFDSFLLCEGEVDTSNTFTINGTQGSQQNETCFCILQN